MTRHILPGWTAVIADRHDAETFTRDINHLRELGAQVLAANHQPSWQHQAIYTQVWADLSPQARRAITGAWPERAFRELWAAA